MNIELKPIAIVKNSRDEMIDDNWGSIESQILLDDSMPEHVFDGLEDFSHLEIIFYFHKVDESKISFDLRHPRGNKNWPKLGLYSQRHKNRPNRLGLTIVKLIKREGGVLTVRNLDAINGTPILDIKPVIKEFLPNGDIKQPTWCSELMKDYWA